MNAVAFHPDGTCVAAGSADRTVKLWDLRSNALLQHYPAHGDAVTGVSFHESGNYALSSGMEGSLKIWDLREGQLLYTLHGHQGAVTSSCFAPKGGYFGSGGEDKMVMVWKSSLERIVGGEKQRDVEAKTKVRGGQPLSYYSPKRKGAETSVNVSRLANTTRIGTPNKSMGGSSPFRGLVPEASKAGKEFVLEELTGGDVGGEEDYNGNVGDNLIGRDKGPAIPKDQLPEVLAGTLDHIVGQLDMVTRTLAILDKRLSLQEDLMSKHVFGGGGEEN